MIDVRPAPVAHKRWVMHIKQIDKVDPLECPKCGSKTKNIAFIDQPGVIYENLNHLDLLDPSDHDSPRAPPDSELTHL